jgi:SAM-dependent methyltransferase
MRKLDKEKPWFAEWFDENYRMLYRHRNSEDAKQQVQLILDTLKPKKNETILDLCCGEGRYTEILDKMGYRIYGIDLSETLVFIGKQREPRLKLMVGDMRTIPGRYDIVLSLFTSFGYFDGDDENEAALRSVFRSIKPGGKYWLDFLNAHYVAKHLVPETVSILPSGIEVREKRRIEGGRIIKDILFKGTETNGTAVKKESTGDNGFNGDKHYVESVRLFSRQDLEQMMARTGFNVIDCFGDYRGEPCSEDSERVILVGEKNE